jgi:hypothetical protein
MRRRTSRLIALALLLAVAGCGQNGPDTSRAREASPSEPSHQDFGDYQVHYNAVRSDELSADVARAFGIERSANRVLLNVSMVRKDADERTSPVDGMVTATAHNLNGQLKDLQVRRVTEGQSVYFIGEVGIAGAEILVFDIQARPEGQTNPYKVQLKREFFAD